MATTAIRPRPAPALASTEAEAAVTDLLGRQGSSLVRRTFAPARRSFVTAVAVANWPLVGEEFSP